MRKLRLFTLVVLTLMLTAAAHAQFSVLYNYSTSNGSPEFPSAPGIIAQGRNGNLYSTSNFGGTSFVGNIFKFTPKGVYSDLYNFDGTLGCYPQSGLTLGRDGNFYGTQTQCGATAYGSVFKVTPSGSVTILYNFQDNGDGRGPYAPPIEGTDGNFYGTTVAGGNNQCNGGNGCGTIYKLTPSGQITTLHQFNNTDGYTPIAPLVQGTDGNFYGTTTFGGNAGDNGVIFKVTPSGKFTVLYNFDGTHGNSPAGPLIQANDGNFYGTTEFGGNRGVIFKMTPAGALTVLHNFGGSGDGSAPQGGVVQGTDGNFYGTTADGGSKSFGIIFKMTPHGSYSVLYNFDQTTGFYPITLIQHTNGILYGETMQGGNGTCQCGVFFNLNAGLSSFVSLLPYSGKVGKTIEFLGQNFTSSTTVSFNGTPATPTVVSTVYLTAAVPDGATTGFVTVTTSTGKLISNKKFRVTPQITSFKPTSGRVGTVVTLNGVSLRQTTKVTFGGVPATTFTVNSDTQVTATVPAFAKTGHIAITTPGGTAISSGVFTVTQ
jgi:uncharacterized repeat protein (TIGR03803 family)